MSRDTETPGAAGEGLSPIKRALIEIRELRARVTQLEAAAHEPVAIIGAGVRLPGGVNHLQSLWSLLSQGRSGITSVPPDRWDVDAWFDADADAAGRMCTRHGGFIDGVDRFDAAFFGIAPREAETMDPQQRLLLETAWHALEDAGIAPDTLAGSRTGVFIGLANNDYGRHLLADCAQVDAHTSTGNAASVAGGRLSYVLGAVGPNVTVDTACSSSLVALHLAVQSLRRGECDLALVGGVNLMLTPEVHISFSRGRMLAPDGQCKTFDAQADGYVRSEGCAVVVLRRAGELRDGEHARALVRGTAINQDGRSGGLTAPNGPAQEAVIRAALADARIDAAAVGYVEAHGTGTPLGDPIELHALAAALGAGRSTDAPLLIGSIKTNIGHLEAAAGLAGLLKVVLALEHECIPPHLNFTTPSPQIDWAACPHLSVPRALTAWPPIGGRRIAGVSAFGFSGTNAHAVLEQAAAPTHRAAAPAGELRRPLLLALSARDDAALAALATAMAQRLEDPLVAWDWATLATLAASANTQRAHLPRRASVRAHDAALLRERMRTLATGHTAPGVVRSAATVAGEPRIAFLFTGGGAQSVGMAMQLDRSSSVFRAKLNEAAAILDPLLGHPLRELIEAAGEHDAPIHQTRHGQPALVAVEIALAALWRSWGIEPVAVLGHSLGEYAAAHIAGVLSLRDALHIVVERTRQVDALQVPGAMATLFEPAQRVAERIAASGSRAVIAAYNGPEQVAVSGPAADVEALACDAEARGVRVARLRVAYASHSPLMDPLLDGFERAIADVRPMPPHLTLLSNLSGGVADPDLLGGARYWRDHLRQPVRFESSMRALHGLGITHCIEIGPHPVLLGMAAACLPPDACTWLPSLRRDEDDWSVMLESLQVLYADGAAINWAGFEDGPPHRRVDLPLYPFQRRRFWALGAATPHSSSDPAHAWNSMVTALDHEAERAPIGTALQDHGARWAALADLARAHATSVLREAGLFARAGESHSTADVAARLGAPPTYHHLLARWLQALSAAGTLQPDADGRFTSLAPLPEPALARAAAAAQRALADNQPLLDYVTHCGRLLGSVLRGETSPLETLFPGGDFSLADGLYRRSSTMRYVNGLAAAAVRALVAARPGARLSVLEVGAGTGGTTAAVLAALPPQALRQYLFTDASAFFFDRARDEFGRSHGHALALATLDLDRDLAEQGLAGRQFDLVLASNAVHAARDLRGALARLRSLTAPGGMLLLIESTTHLAWFDITTGLIEGWQHFADDDLRREHPLLDAPTWLRMLSEAGFEQTQAWPHQGSVAAEIAQHVLLARAGGTPGVLRLDHPATTSAESVAAAPTTAAAQPDAQALRLRLARALPAERIDLLCELVRERVMQAMKLAPDQAPSRQQRLKELGFDSLMAVQLRNRLTADLSLDKPLPATVMYDHPTIDALAHYLDQRLAPAVATATGAADDVGIGAVGTAMAAPLGVAAVAALSDAQIEALLTARLADPTPR
jgi:acyl transferase domain-containing protein/SAM-dependent methyltransferase